MKPSLWPWNLFIKIGSPSTSSFSQIPSMASESNGLLQNNGFQASVALARSPEILLRCSLLGQAQAHPESLEGTWNFLRIWICNKFPRYWSYSSEDPHRTRSLHRELQFPWSHLWLSCCEKEPGFLSEAVQAPFMGSWFECEMFLTAHTFEHLIFSWCCSLGRL